MDSESDPVNRNGIGNDGGRTGYSECFIVGIVVRLGRVGDGMVGVGWGIVEMVYG